jgi:hypothetical protein
MSELDRWEDCQMNERTERLCGEITILSRNIFISSFLFGVLAFVLSMAKLSSLSSLGFLILVFVIFICLMPPSIFILLGKPWFAQAWLLGINQIYFPRTTWGQLTHGRKFMIYFYSILFSVVAVAILIETLVSISKK